MKKLIVLGISLLMLGTIGCSREGLGGAAVGALGAGAAYEYSAKRQMDQLKEDRAAGRITEEEYAQRKAQIERGSLIY
jgi:hypothetical protein